MRKKRVFIWIDALVFLLFFLRKGKGAKITNYVDYNTKLWV